MRNYTDAINEIIRRNYKQYNWDYENVKITLDGFYMLDIQFEDSPYFFDIKDSYVKVHDYGSMYGHVFFINQIPFCVSSNGIYHLESSTLFKIDSLTFYGDEDVLITYKAKFTHELASGESETITLPVIETHDIKNYLGEIIVIPSTVPYNILNLPQENITGIDIEAPAGTSIELNGNNEIIIGKNEFFSCNCNITSIVFLGVYNEENIISNDTPEIHIYFYGGAV